MRKTGDANDTTDIFSYDIGAASGQLRDQLINLSKRMRVFDLAMQLPGNRTALVPNLENNFRRSVRERHRTEVIRLLGR